MSPRLAALCFGNFMIGTGTMIVPGMLPALAEGLDVSLPAVGQLISAAALVVCLGAPLLAGATSRVERRALLTAVLLLNFAGHAASALLASYPAMLAVRMITACGPAIYTAQAAATAALLHPPRERGRAMAFVFLGWSFASVLGMPLGAYVGATLGWQVGFWMVAAGSLLAAAALWRTLPAGLHIQPLDRALWGEVFSHRPVLLVLSVTALQGSAQFVLLSYFVPGVLALVKASPGFVSALLATFGIAGLIGNTAAGRLTDRFGAPRVALGAILAMMAGHLLWLGSPGAPAWLAASVLVWGTGCFAVNSAQQARLYGLSQKLAPASIALNTSGINLGSAAGTALAGALLAFRPGVEGYSALPWLSVTLFLGAIAASVSASKASAAAATTAARR